MNHYIMIRRLRGPVILLLIGVIALLDETGVINGFWHWFWPLLLILIGVLMLAERAALAAAGVSGQGVYPCQPFQGSNMGDAAQSSPAVSPDNVSSNPQDSAKDSEGGQS